MKRLGLRSWGSVFLASLLCGKLYTLQNPESSCQQSVEFREPAFSSFQGANPADIMGWLGWTLAVPFIFGGGCRLQLPLSTNMILNSQPPWKPLRFLTGNCGNVCRLSLQMCGMVFLSWQLVWNLVSMSPLR